MCRKNLKATPGHSSTFLKLSKLSAGGHSWGFRPWGGTLGRPPTFTFSFLSRAVVILSCVWGQYGAGNRWLSLFYIRTLPGNVVLHMLSFQNLDMLALVTMVTRLSTIRWCSPFHSMTYRIYTARKTLAALPACIFSFSLMSFYWFESLVPGPGDSGKILLNKLC